MINFDNVILDTDFASVSFRDERYGHHARGSDPGLHDFDSPEPAVKEKRKKKNVVSAVAGAFKRQSAKTKDDQVIEMKDFNNIDHYVIDDEDLPLPDAKNSKSDTQTSSSGVQKRAEKRENRQSREIVFDSNSFYE